MTGDVLGEVAQARSAVRTWRRLEWALVGALIVFAVVFVARTPWSLGSVRGYSLFDDAMVSMRYAHNLAHGHGLGWNPTGPRVEGYSNTLWTLWLAALHLLPLPATKISLAASASGAGVLVGNALVCRALVRRLAPDHVWAPAAVLALLVAYYPLNYWALRGMEVGIVSLLFSSAALLAMRTVESGSVPRLLPVVLVLALLCRDDAFVGCAIVIAWIVWQSAPADRMRLARPLVLTTVGTVALHTLFRRVYYHAWLPNTYYLKLGHIPITTRLHRGVLGLVAIGELEVGLLVIVAGAYLLARRRSVPPGAWMLAGLFAAQCAYSAFVGGDAWEATQFANRYVASGAAVLIVVAVLAVADLTSRPDGRRELRWCALAMAPLLVLRAFDVIPVAKLQLGRLPTEWAVTRVGFPLLGIAGLLAAAWALRPAGDGARRIPPAGVAVGLVVVLGVVSAGRELTVWTRHNAFLLPDNENAPLGLVIGQHTDPSAVIGVTAAGGIVYFADRQAVDLGGKSDSHVAHEAPSIRRFIPGHDKIDLAYSIGQLRPDLVVGIFGPADVDRVLGFGYTRISLRVYVRTDSTHVDRAGLAAALGGPPA